MSFTSFEWIVLIFALIGLIKLAIILVSKRQWLPVIEEVYGNPGKWSAILFILSIVIFYYLIQELTIVQILAVMVFTALSIGVMFLQFSREFLKLARKMINKKFKGWIWVYVIIWTVLLVWGLIKIF